MEPSVIFENKDLLVLNKPAGWVVNDAATTSKLNTIQSWLKGNFTYDIVSSKAFRSGIVHRIDKETSGILLIAKNLRFFRYLQEQFKLRRVEKTYLALVHGEVRPGEGKITAPVGRLPWRRDRFGVISGGREAETSYGVVKYYKATNEKYSLVELRPKTGRTHQIRIHLKYLGFPIVADDFYAGRKTSRKDHLWCPRLFLHAFKIAFRDPKAKILKFEADLSPDLAEALNKLELLA